MKPQIWSGCRCTSVHDLCGNVQNSSAEKLVMTGLVKPEKSRYNSQIFYLVFFPPQLTLEELLYKLSWTFGATVMALSPPSHIFGKPKIYEVNFV